jgi:hypothetical protein
VPEQPTLLLILHFSAPGADVMITIFCDFRQFSAKNAVFLKNQCYDQNFEKFSFVLSRKRQFFRRIFQQKYFKNHNIGPRHCNKMPRLDSAHLIMGRKVRSGNFWKKGHKSGFRVTP